MTGFYTYLHCKPDGAPFYVGKGSGNRSHDFTNGRNAHHKNVVAKHGRKNVKVFIFECESEDQALSDEVQQIAQLLRDGCQLVNMTAGGDGLSGFSHTAETRAKISAAKIGNRDGIGNKSRTGQKSSMESRAKISASLMGNTRTLGRKQSEESKAKKSAATKGRPKSPEVRANMSAAAKARWNKERGIKND